MSWLTALGASSLVFVVVFTAVTYCGGANPRAAIIEAWVNIAIGFAVNFSANFLLLPLVGAHFTAGENFWLGWVYTTVSILRQYAVRRWFQERLHAAAMRLAGGV